MTNRESSPASTVVNAPQPFLRIETGPQAGHVIRLALDGCEADALPVAGAGGRTVAYREVIFGRGEQCTVRVLDENASRAHSRVSVSARTDGEATTSDGTATPRAPVVHIEDLGSRNGTWLHGRRLPRDTPRALESGDRFVIGNTSVRLHVDTADEVETVVEAPDSGLRVRTRIAAADVPRVAGEAARSANVTELFRLQSSLSGDVLDLEPFLEQAAKRARSLIPCDTAAIVQFDENGAALATYRAPRVRPRLALSETILARVRDDGEALLLADLSSQASPTTKTGGTTEEDTRPKSLIQQGIHSAIGVPLLASTQPDTASGPRRVAGMLYFDRRDKPDAFSADDLSYAVQVAEVLGRALGTASRYRALVEERASVPLAAETAEDHILGDSPPMRACLDLLAKVAPTSTPVLLLGETGTGKELFARAIYQQSACVDGPFVALNCAAIPADLLEAELFGHEAGAFTGATRRRSGKLELAAGGTLFLDEIGELPLDLQPKLLRALQEKAFYRVGGDQECRVDFRLICATNRDLKTLAETGRFREDLLFRIQVVSIELPPLRDRPDDIDALAPHLARKVARRLARRFDGFKTSALIALKQYAWPGNVRELENVIERAIVLADGPELDASHFPAEIARATDDKAPVRGSPTDAAAATDVASATPASPFDEERFPVMPLKEAQRLAVLAALRHTGGKKGEAAALLGISWPTLRKKLREYGIDS